MLRTSAPKRPKKLKYKKGKRIKLTKRVKRRKYKGMDVDLTPEELQALNKVQTIFYDPDTGKYYYPNECLLEKDPIIRSLVVQVPKFVYDKKGKVYVDPDTGDEYVKLADPEEFKRDRRTAMAKQKGAENVAIVKNTPIYFNKNNGKYYYPVIAIQETEKLQRPIIKKGKKFPLALDPGTQVSLGRNC